MSNILLVDDHYMTCIGMGMLAKKVIENPVLYFSNNYEDALAQMSGNKMDLIILDLGIPGGLGIGMIKGFRQIQQDVRILVCTGRDELLNAPSYIFSGANGFLHKASSDGQIENAISMVLDGKIYVSPSVHQEMFKTVLDHKPVTNPLESLSPRERQVLECLMAGKWTKEIAEELNVKFSTVSTQKAKIFQKFKVGNIVDLVRQVDICTG